MATLTVTAPQLTLMQRTDVVATHLLIIAQGMPTGRVFMVPAGKTLRQYDESKAPLAGSLGLVGLVIRGKLPPSQTALAGQRTPDYTLAPLNSAGSHHAAGSSPHVDLLHYVERSGREPRTSTSENGVSLGPGVVCDLLYLRSRPMSSWFTGRQTRLSQLVSERLLRQYAQIHCLVSPIKR
jgi:hypothetical protein